jgi:SAM-dependent methyltransferase
VTAVDISRAAAEYWDANHEKAKDPTFWMAHPICRATINRRVTGSEHEWPPQWFRRTHVPVPFGRAVSWGCGTAYFERAAISFGIAREIDGFDLSPVSLEKAREETAREGVAGITFRLGDFNDPQIAHRRYDIALFHASLHHVSSLERLFRRLASGLKSRGYVYIESEFVGPSRDEWKPEYVRVAQARLDLVPDEAKLNPIVPFPIEPNDPSEAVQSGDITRIVHDFFDFIEWRPFGGQLVDLILPNVSHGWAHSPAGYRFVDAVLRIEEDQLWRDPKTTHHIVAFGRLKPRYRLGLPIAAQIGTAGKRRATRLARRLRIAASASA